MQVSKIYAVLNEDEVVFASEDRNEAEAFAEDKRYEARKRVLNDWDNDDPDVRDLDEADLQAGADGDIYEVIKVDLSKKTEDNMVELDNGVEIEVEEILEMLSNN